MKGPNQTSGWQRLKAFFSDVVTELKKVLWPNRKEVVTYSSGVVGVIIAIAFLIWILDWAFRNLTTLVLGLYPRGS